MSADQPRDGEATASDTELQASTLGWTGDTDWATVDRPAGAVVLVVALGAFWIAGDVAGVLAWLVLAGCWLLFPPVVPVTVGHICLVAVTPDEAPLTSVLLASAAILGLFAADFIDSNAWLPSDRRQRVSTRQNVVDGVGYVGTALALAAIVTYAEQVTGVLVAGSCCLAAVGLVGLGLRPRLAENTD